MRFFPVGKKNPFVHTDLYLAQYWADSYRAEKKLSQTRYEGWKREYDKRKALEAQIDLLHKDVTYWTTQYMKESANQCGAFSATLFREEIGVLKNEVKKKDEALERARQMVRDTWPQEQRVKDLEKENAALEGENRDLGSRVLDLTRKLTAANDWRDYLSKQYRAL